MEGHNWVIKDFDHYNQEVVLTGFDDGDAEYISKEKDEYAQFNEIKSIKSIKDTDFQYDKFYKNIDQITFLMKKIGYENI